MRYGYFEIKSFQNIIIKPGYELFLFQKARFLPKHAYFKLKRSQQSIKSSPYELFASSKLKRYCIIGIGGNKPHMIGRFLALLHRLTRRKKALFFSPILKNPAFGYECQDDFYNAIIWLESKQGVFDFFSYMMYLERSFGRQRKRAFKNAPRTLDIDILGFQNKSIHLPHLQIPHPQWTKRESVCLPLCQMPIGVKAIFG